MGLLLNFTCTVSIFPKAMHFVFISLTAVKFLLQNSCSPSSCLWRPLHVSAMSMRSSAHSRCMIMTSPIQTPNLHLRYSPMSAIYFLNNRPLATPPWFTPMALCIRKLIQPLFFTRKDVFLYKLRSVSITFPCQPDFIILYNRMFLFTRSKALEKSTKQTANELPRFNCRWTKHCRTNILSAVLLPWRNPPLCSSILLNASLAKLSRR